MSAKQVEYLGLEHCFVFFNEAMIVGLCLQLPVVIDVQKVSKSFDTFMKLIEHLFNEEKDINKFTKLQNILNILRILVYQIISLIVCTCLSSVLCHHTRDPLCTHN